MQVRGILALGLCLAVAGIALGDDGMGHSRPKSVTAVCMTDSAEVSWEPMADPGLTGFNVYQRALGQSYFTKANSELVIISEFEVVGLLVGIDYEFTVTAVIDSVESEMSQPDICTTG